ncbi:MAG: metal-dependent hydrolase, partial [Flavobacteriales bacterium]|nr:metal-dependent hydrolase [Flavobacteriales bacterium]
ILGGLADKSLLMQLIGVYILIAGRSSHRTFTHSLLGLSLILYISYQFSAYRGFQGFAAGLAAGTVLHILADSFTSGGVSLFYPIYNRRIGFPITMKSGGLTERAIFIISLMIAVISIISF